MCPLSRTSLGALVASALGPECPLSVTVVVVALGPEICSCAMAGDAAVAMVPKKIFYNLFLRKLKRVEMTTEQ